MNLSLIKNTEKLVTKPSIKSLIHSIFPLIDSSATQDGKAFPKGYALKPYHQAKHIGWTHYGVMIPELPAPHQFFSIMSVIGTLGALAFDTDHVFKDSPRNNATAVMGTAATYPDQFNGYSIPKECQLDGDGSHIQFGQNINIKGCYPHYHVIARATDFELNIKITNTDKVTWFIKSPIYDHFSLLSQYEGVVSYRGETQKINGLCTFEYAACISPYMIRDKVIPSAFKIPLDFFTYQIINLDDNTQLLLNDTRLKDVKIVSKAFIRGLDQYNQSFEAEFEVLSYQDKSAISPDGVEMNLPATFRWVIKDPNKTLAIINGQVDTPMIYGLGSGYVGAYLYKGEYQDTLIEGRGYIEYIDRRK